MMGSCVLDWVFQFLAGLFCSLLGFFLSMVGSSVFGVDCCGFFHYMPRSVVFVAGPFSADLGHLQKNARFWGAF
jgi:hypothetical protein